MYWPSFNAALGEFGSQQQRAIINTILSLTTSVIAACLFSRIASNRYLDMIIVANATLAGGSAMGAAADLINYPFCAMIVGFVTGALASIGFAFINPFMRKYLGLHDSQGVLYSHGLPGIIGGFVSTISAGLAQRNFGDRFPDYFYSVADKELRSAHKQAAY